MQRGERRAMVRRDLQRRRHEDELWPLIEQEPPEAFGHRLDVLVERPIGKVELVDPCQADGTPQRPGIARKAVTA